MRFNRTLFYKFLVGFFIVCWLTTDGYLSADAFSVSNSVAVPDANQLSSISTTCPAILLSSGPGSGKSRVLSARVCHLLLERHRVNGVKRSQAKVSGKGLFILSFSKADAVRIRQRSLRILHRDEMFKSRVDLRQLESEVWAGTLHGFASTILKNFGGIVPRVHRSRKRLDIIEKVLSDMRSSSSIPKELYEQSLVSSRGGGASTSNLISSIHQIIQFWKESALLGAVQFHDDFLKRERMPRELLSVCNHLCLHSTVAEVAYLLYPQYQKALRIDNAVDTSDLTLMAYKFLENNPSVLEEIRSQFVNHLIVDEYQDISPSQRNLLQIIVCGNPKHTDGIFLSTGSNLSVPHLFAAGDCNQSIYGWRGAQARQNVKQFRLDFPQSLIVPLEICYRTPHHILSAATSIVGHCNDMDVFQKPLKTFELSPAAKTALLKSSPNLVPKDLKEWEKRVMIKELWDPRAEAQYIASEITKRFNMRRSESLKGDHFFDLNVIAVLVRTTAQMRELEEALAERKLPYITEGSPVFNLRANSRFQDHSLEMKRREQERKRSVNISLRRASSRFSVGSSMVRESCREEFYNLSEVDSALSLLNYALNVNRKETEDIESIFFKEWGNVFTSKVWSKHWKRHERQFVLQLFFSKLGLVRGVSGKRDVAEQVLQTLKLDDFDTDVLLTKMYCDSKDASYDQEAMERKKESIRNLSLIASKYRKLISFLNDVSLGEEEPISYENQILPNAEFTSSLKMSPVRLMTMHRCKGEEFDDVYLCGWEEGIFPQRSAKSKIALEEEKRLAFVALTRARQRAVITYACRRRRSSGVGAVQSMPSRFLVELLNKQGLGKESVIAFAGGSGMQGLKPNVSGIDLQRFIHSTKNQPHAPTNIRRALKSNLCSNISTDEQQIENSKKGKKCTLLHDVSQDIRILTQNRRLPSGCRDRIKMKFKKMLKDHFGISRGTAHIIDRVRLRQNSLKISDISEIPAEYMTSKALSRCTAVELGDFLNYLLASEAYS